MSTIFWILVRHRNDLYLDVQEFHDLVCMHSIGHIHKKFPDPALLKPVDRKVKSSPFHPLNDRVDDRNDGDTVVVRTTRSGMKRLRIVSTSKEPRKRRSSGDQPSVDIIHRDVPQMETSVVSPDLAVNDNDDDRETPVVERKLELEEQQEMTVESPEPNHVHEQRKAQNLVPLLQRNSKQPVEGHKSSRRPVLKTERPLDTKARSSQRTKIKTPGTTTTTTSTMKRKKITALHIVPCKQSETLRDVGLFNCKRDVLYLGKVLGEGTDGRVEAVKIHGQVVALKTAKRHDNDNVMKTRHRCGREVHYLRQVRHVPQFIQCLGVCDAHDHTCIALEAMDTKLSEYQRQVTRGIKSGLDVPVILDIVSQVAQAMICLHETMNVAHGDLACRNILVRRPRDRGETLEIKVSDFGRVVDCQDEPEIDVRRLLLIHHQTSSSSSKQERQPQRDDFQHANFSFHRNLDVGSFGREVLFRLVVGDVIPPECLEPRPVHCHVFVNHHHHSSSSSSSSGGSRQTTVAHTFSDTYLRYLPPELESKLGSFQDLFYSCVRWGNRPSFREIQQHLCHYATHWKHHMRSSDKYWDFPLKSQQNDERPAQPPPPPPPVQQDLSFVSPDNNSILNTKVLGQNHHNPRRHQPRVGTVMSQGKENHLRYGSTLLNAKPRLNSSEDVSLDMKKSHLTSVVTGNNNNGSGAHAEDFFSPPPHRLVRNTKGLRFPAGKGIITGKTKTMRLLNQKIRRESSTPKP